MPSPSHPARVTPPRRPHVLWSLVVIGVLVTAAACGGTSPTATPSTGPVVALDPDLQSEAVAARDDGAAYLAEHYDDIDPLHLSGLGYLQRRWGIDVLAGAPAVGVAQLEAIRATSSDDSRSGAPPQSLSVDPTEILALERFVDPQRSEPPDTTGLSEVAIVLAGALHCDVAPLDDDALARWDELTALGGYEATHVVMAWFTATEVGCGDGDVAAAGARATERVAEEFSARLAADLTPDDVDDLLIEQAAFLERVGRGDVFTATFVQALVDAQLPDGGWPRTAGDTASDWHATALAVWALSAATGPSNDVRWIEA
jgi:hypothetical protein